MNKNQILETIKMSVTLERLVLFTMIGRKSGLTLSKRIISHILECKQFK